MQNTSTKEDPVGKIKDVKQGIFYNQVENKFINFNTNMSFQQEDMFSIKLTSDKVKILVKTQQVDR